MSQSRGFKPKSLFGFYGRLFLASQPSADVARLIDPASNVNVPAKINVSPDRNYNPITEKLSSEERTEAWKGKEFTQAYKEWRTGVAKAIRGITDQKKSGSS